MDLILKSWCFSFTLLCNKLLQIQAFYYVSRFPPVGFDQQSSSAPCDVSWGYSYLEGSLGWNAQDGSLTWLAVDAHYRLGAQLGLLTGSFYFPVCPLHVSSQCDFGFSYCSRKWKLLFFLRYGPRSPECHFYCILLVKVGISPTQI